jgi:hypothetical protein
MKDVTCPTCGRTVKEVNYWKDIGTCRFCDINRTGEEVDET